MEMPITKSEVSYTINLTERMENVPTSKLTEVKNQIGSAVIESIKSDASRQLSSATGKQWKGLKKGAYKEFKRKKGKGSLANLKFDGDMLGGLAASNTTTGVKIEVEGGSTQTKKAFNHITADTIWTPRQFLPFEGGEFRRAIENKIDGIIEANSEDKKEVRTELGFRDAIEESLERQIKLQGKESLFLSVPKTKSIDLSQGAIDSIVKDIFESEDDGS